MLQNRGPNWHDDRKLCQNQGADLVSIETVKEWNFLNDLIQNRNKLKRYNEWIISLEKKGRNWTWVSGKPLTINKWKENQPFIDRDFHAGDQGISTNLLGVAPKAYICEIPKGKTNLRLLSAK